MQPRTSPGRRPGCEALPAILGGASLVLAASLAVSGACMVRVLPTTQRTGWTNFAIEDSWVYSEMADMFCRHGLLYDGDDVDKSARSRMPLYPLMILSLQRLGEATGLSSAALITALNA